MNNHHAAPLANGNHEWHMPWKQYLNRQQAGGGTPGDHVVTGGCCSLRFLRSQSTLLPAEWAALHPPLVRNLRQVHILRENRLKSLFLLSFYRCCQWPALYATHQNAFWLLLENEVADLWSTSHGHSKIFLSKNDEYRWETLASFIWSIKGDILFLEVTILLGDAFGNEIVWKRRILKQTKMQPFYSWDDCCI